MTHWEYGALARVSAIVAGREDWFNVVAHNPQTGEFQLNINE